LWSSELWCSVDGYAAPTWFHLQGTGKPSFESDRLNREGMIANCSFVVTPSRLSSCIFCPFQGMQFPLAYPRPSLPSPHLPITGSVVLHHPFSNISLLQPATLQHSTSTMKMETVFSYEILITICQITQYHNPECHNMKTCQGST
jgi:hypothetical protein